MTTSGTDTIEREARNVMGTQWVVDDREHSTFRVHRATMVHPDILEAERDRIFSRSWLYVGHESEIPNSHDFRARDVGGRPLILTRDATGSVRVFYNTCTHRGAVLCRQKEGNGRFLKCFYHAWSFDTSGRLVSLPDEASYGPAFDRASCHLRSPAQVGSYRGFVFVCFDPAAVDLLTYLGGARPYLDLVCDQSETGMEILRGTHEYSLRANWKLLVENSIDGYHAMPTHQRYLEMVMSAGASPVGFTAYRGADLGNGHAVVESVGARDGVGRPPAGEARRLWDERRAEVNARCGEEWGSRIYGLRNVLIFPNLVVIDLVGGIVVRKIDPVRPDYMEVTAWELAPVGEPDALRALRLDNFLTFWGPGGFATPDDVEALECCQRGFKSLPDVEWNDISRGMARDVPSGNDETQMRAFWRHWNELMTGEVLPPEDHRVPVEFSTTEARR